MFPDILKQLRKSRKVNQATLAEALGMSQASITSWENGKRMPDIDMLVKLADYFNVTTDYLLGRIPTDVAEANNPPAAALEGMVRIVIPSDEEPEPDDLERRIYEIVAKELQKRGL